MRAETARGAKQVIGWIMVYVATGAPYFMPGTAAAVYPTEAMCEANLPSGTAKVSCMMLTQSGTQIGNLIKGGGASR